MSDAPEKNLILSSVNQVLTLVKGNPQLAAALPKFSPLLSLQAAETPTKSCNCSMNVSTPAVSKQITEAILSSLNSEDFMTIKNILVLDKLCYYKRNSVENKLELICV
jgi:hypothetical protein